MRDASLFTVSVLGRPALDYEFIVLLSLVLVTRAQGGRMLSRCCMLSPKITSCICLSATSSSWRAVISSIEIQLQSETQSSEEKREAIQGYTKLIFQAAVHIKCLVNTFYSVGRMCILLLGCRIKHLTRLCGSR